MTMELDKIEAPDVLRWVLEEMEADGHGVPQPTHLFRDGTELIGAFSVAYAPCLFFWMHSGRGSAFSSFKAFRDALGTLHDMGHPNPILLIEPNSPFYKYLPRLGYGVAGQGEIWMRV